MKKLIIMSQKELNRYGIILKLIHGKIKNPKAADLLNLSTRQVRRLKVKVKKFGPRGLIHRNRGKPSNNRISNKEKEKIIKLIRKHYIDFKPGFATEKLRDEHGIVKDPETIRKIMTAEGLWIPRRSKKAQGHRSWRQRKSCFGEMEQFDGSYHNWFEERSPQCCLLASIDDATGRITKAMFVSNEGIKSVFGFWKNYLLSYGKPRSLYLDKFSTYKMNPRFARENHELKTQFERAMNELKIKTITAHSPQAKGRIERLFNTLQDRLIKEMRLRGIKTVQKANQFLKEEFIPMFNTRFAIKPALPIDLHQKLSNQEKKKLDSIFSKQYPRIVQNDFTVSFQNRWYQLTKEQPVTVCKKDKVTIEEQLNNSVHIRLRGKYLNYKALPIRPKKARNRPWVIAASAPLKQACLNEK